MSALLLTLLTSTSAPDSVVVFPDRAQVTRLASVPCAARLSLTFVNVPPSAAEDSFRARVEVGAVIGLRAVKKSRDKEFSAAAASLTQKLDDVNLQIGTLTDVLLQAEQKDQVGTQYALVAAQFVVREMSVGQPDTNSWHAAFEHSLSRRLSAAKTRAETKQKLQALNRSKEELELQLANVKSDASKEEFEVEVLASCPPGKTAQVSLTYWVGSTGWAPAYEARADEGAGSVDMATYATVTQGSQEDWKDVALTLSTAVPAQNATPPELNKLLVGAIEQQPAKKVLVRRDEAVARAQTGGSSGTQRADNARAQGLSVQLEVPGRNTVLGDKTPIRVLVGNTKMKATFELRATPKLYPVAFRVASVTNQAPWPLLPGNVDVFRSSGLVGHYALERVPQGAPMTLSLGIEDAIRVKRMVVEELKKDVGLFNDRKRFNYAYRFEVSNFGKANAQVQVVDHLPVSELADIAVSVSSNTTSGFQLEKDDGLARWKVDLKPGEKKMLTFAFHVDVPNSYELSGL
jgi:uncharacterized protein (TIGR02231 family)